MSGTSIGEPFLLSSYKRSQKAKAMGSTQGASNLHASYVRPSGGSSDGCVTVAAQSDGIHVLDISTLHPIISHTLGPSTTFACPPLTLCISDSKEKTYATYSVIASSPDVDPAEGGRTIWSWTENLSDSLADRAAQKLKSVIMPKLIFGLYECIDLPSRLFIFSINGGLTVTDMKLETKCTRPCEADAKILQVFIFPQQGAFLPARTTSVHGAVLVLVEDLDAGRCRVRVLNVNNEDVIWHAGDGFLPLTVEEIVDISCSASGCLSVLCKSGSWRTFQISSRNHEPLTISPMLEPIPLCGFSFISSSPDYASILALNSSHVFLCGLVKSSTPEIVLQIWDLQYSVLLASHALSIPPTLSQSKGVTIRVKLVPGSMSQVILVLSPAGPKSTSMHTSVLVVPISIPFTSTIANAMGKASAGAKWINTGAGNTGVHGTGQYNLLEAMRTAMVENRPQVADEAFFEWIKNEGIGEDSLNDDDENVDRVMDLNYILIQTILDIIIQPSKVGNVAYSPGVVRFMLENRMISGNMLNGGILTALRLRNDWKSIQLAFASVPDITESEIINTLKVVINHHRQTSSTTLKDASAMSVDIPTTTPGDLTVLALHIFLASCVQYPTTPSSLQAALGQYLYEAEDILVVLSVLDNWIQRWNKQTVVLLPSNKDIERSEKGVAIVKRQKKKESPNGPPPLAKILSFLQTLLDASFLPILQHESSHRVLKLISDHIQPEIVYIDEVERLRGSLEPFSRAQAKAAEEGGEEKRKGPVGDWRLRKKLVREQAGIEIGLYRLEELVL